MERKPHVQSLKEAAEKLGVTGEPNPTPERRPRYDDEQSRPSLFKTEVADAVLENLTLPGFFIGRSGLFRVTLRNCDLHLSTWCWNDFVDCDFSGSDLSDSDLRAAIFHQCRFAGAKLRGCDFRRSGFGNCDFTGADLDGALATRDQADSLKLTPQQSAQVKWTDDPGPEPDGG
jgi:uncharacterized protein YjbI with pentapeptide repeats